jgi:hypothetical protein
MHALPDQGGAKASKMWDEVMASNGQSLANER